MIEPKPGHFTCRRLNIGQKSKQQLKAGAVKAGRASKVGNPASGGVRDFNT